MALIGTQTTKAYTLGTPLVTRITVRYPALATYTSGSTSGTVQITGGAGGVSISTR